MQKRKLLGCIAAVVALSMALGWVTNRPQFGGPDVPAGKLKSVSFAPFREGFSPLEERFPLREHVEADIKLLADATEGIRTYSSLGGMEPVPEFARAYGLKVTQGAWLGWGEKDNAKELDALIASARAHPDVVTRVIVGNEVLLRGELPVERLIESIRTVKRSIPQPVSYADVWSMYLKHPELLDEVDFITIHILPYWEDEPVSIDRAIDHLERVVSHVEAEAQALGVTKPIFIGESGWPSAGRQRGYSVPSVVNAARYSRGMIEVTRRHGFDYNIVEAFNQPWKAKLEGVVGANWGLFGADRTPVYPLTGLVTERATWKIEILTGALVWILLLLVYRRKLAGLPPVRLFAFLSFVLLLTATLSHFTSTQFETSYTALDRLLAVMWVLLNGALGGLLINKALRILSERPDWASVPPAYSVIYLAFVLFALYRTFHLALHGRYLSFPLEQFGVPVFGIVGCGLFAYALNVCRRGGVIEAVNHAPSRPRRLERTLGVLLLLGCVGLVVGETKAFVEARDLRSVYPDFRLALPRALEYTLGNAQLVGWIGCLIILSAPLLIGPRFGSLRRHRAA